MTYSHGAVRKEILCAIRDIQCRPTNVNFPNDPIANKTKVLPYMNVFLLSAPTVQPFVGTELRKQQLVQVDFFVDVGVSLDTMDSYVDAFGKQFHNYRNFGLTRVSSPPEITIQGEEDNAYRLSLTFVMEYITQ